MSGSGWAPREAHPADATLLSELRGRARPADLVLLGAVPAFLLTAFAALDGAPGRFTLSYVDPTPLSMVSAHFVHRSISHLVANLAAYGVVVPTGYTLATLADRRREYLLAFVGLLVALPPTLSALILLEADGGVAFGFSGVTMALVGVLALSLGSFLAHPDRGATGVDVAPGLFFVGLAVAAARSVTVPEYRVATVLASGGVALAYLGWSLGRSPRSASGRGRAWSVVGSPDAQFAAVGAGAFLVGLLAGFPGETQRGTVVVNTYGHLLGYALGFVATYATFRLLGRSPGPEEAGREPV